MSKNRQKYFNLVLSLNNEGEFDGRIVLVLLKNNFIVNEYIEKNFRFTQKIKQEFHYTKMALA